MAIFYTILFFVVISLLAYLIGSIPTAIIIGKSQGIDIREYGSHNAGGTNVGRVISKRAGITTMIIDIFKCFIPCLLVEIILKCTPIENYLVNFNKIEELAVSFCAFFIAIGHSFPIYCHFKGGKAVACFSGYILFISPITFLLGSIVFFTTYLISKRISVSSLIGAPFCILCSLVSTILDLTILNNPASFNGGMYFSSWFMIHLTYITTITITLFVILIYIRHRTNITRIFNHNEPETHFKKSKK